MRSENSLRIRLVCFAIMVALGTVGLMDAAQRTVLGEFITSENCTTCLDAAPTVSGIVDSYPELAFVGIHFGDDYQLPWGFDRAVTFYGPMGFATPYFVVDGLTAPADYSLYEGEYLFRQQVTTDVTIDLSAGSAGGGASAFEFTAHVCVEAGGQGKTMRVYMVEVLDDFPGPPAHFSRNILRQAAATEDVTVAAGACVDVLKTMTLDATSMSSIEDVRIIAWAQAPLATGPAEVYQAAILAGPFDGIFADGFETGDDSRWN